MKLISYFSFWLLVSLIISTACSNNDDDDNVTPTVETETLTESTLTILPVGDSRVAGNRPSFESYRYELWKNLIDNEWNFDLIGPLDDDTSYATYLNQSFDKQHASVGGFTTLDVLEHMETILEDDSKPDIVLLGIGGNDLQESDRSVDETVNSLNEIIDQLQESHDSVTIFLEQIAPGTSTYMDAEITSKFNAYNNKIAEIGVEQTNATSQVIVIDMSENWSDAYMADDVHYNEIGAKVVADRYFTAMDAYFNP